MNNQNEVREKIENLISKYAQVRQEFEDAKKEDTPMSKYIAGNDNYIGIIGEYWAKVFLETLPENIGLQISNSSSEGNKSEKWVDFKIERDNLQEFINVKTIFEDKNNTSGYIKKFHKSSNGNILSIIIIKLNDNLAPKELLYIQDIDNNLKNGIKNYKDRWDSEDEDKPINFRYYKDRFDPIFKDSVWKYEDNQFVKIDR